MDDLMSLNHFKGVFFRVRTEFLSKETMSFGPRVYPFWACLVLRLPFSFVAKPKETRDEHHPCTMSGAGAPGRPGLVVELLRAGGPGLLKTLDEGKLGSNQVKELSHLYPTKSTCEREA